MQLFLYAKPLGLDGNGEPVDWDGGIAVVADNTKTAQALAAQRGVDETWRLIYVGPCEPLARPDIVPGSRVQIVVPNSLYHFLAVGLRCDGVVVRIDPQNHLGGRIRPVVVSFPDRVGEWAYGYHELAWVAHK